jgi:hypothetical protein
MVKKVFEMVEDNFLARRSQCELALKLFKVSEILFGVKTFTSTNSQE